MTASPTAFVEDEELDCANFFDQIDDLLDFSTDDVDTDLPPPESNAFPSIWSSYSESLPSSDSVFSNNSTPDLSAELFVPYEDIVQMEWLSNFVEDSFSGGGSLTMNDNNHNHNKKKEDDDDIKKSSSTHQHFNSSSPVSVHESSSSCDFRSSSETLVLGKCVRARTKRPRPTTTSNPRPSIQLVSPSSSTETPYSESFAESRPLIKIPKHVFKKKVKITVPVEGTTLNSAGSAVQVVRKCMHCEITKTPQWRAGPLGPKTLCNACGVRYKSGRLFPEYRPAASPTFVPELHSNSHKKVVEMRSKGDDGMNGVVEKMEELIPNNALKYM